MKTVILVISMLVSNTGTGKQVVNGFVLERNFSSLATCRAYRDLQRDTMLAMGIRAVRKKKNLRLDNMFAVCHDITKVVGGRRI
jgi:hypothetical protein